MGGSFTPSAWLFEPEVKDWRYWIAGVLIAAIMGSVPILSLALLLLKSFLWHAGPLESFATGLSLGPINVIWAILCLDG